MLNQLSLDPLSGVVIFVSLLLASGLSRMASLFSVLTTASNEVSDFRLPNVCCSGNFKILSTTVLTISGSRFGSLSIKHCRLSVLGSQAHAACCVHNCYLSNHRFKN